MAESASETSEGAAKFAELLDLARRDDNILAFWLGGSRGAGRETRHSDYDCMMVVGEAALDDYAARFEGHKRFAGVDSGVTTLPALEAYAAWGGPQAWDRYSFTRLKVLVDKTALLPALIAAKARIPTEHLGAFIDASADHFVNQVYRSAKTARDGLALAARLEAAESVKPLLDALFALDGGRPRPFPKYLAWELETQPLGALPWPTDGFLARLERVLAHGDQQALQQLLAALDGQLRQAGHAAVLDAWQPELRWMLERETSAQALL